MKPEDYINATVGKPWVNRAEGPDEFDCWGLVIDSFRKIDGIELPQIDGYKDEGCATSKAGCEALEAGNYIKCEPQDGAIMTSWVGGKMIHVGRCLAGGVLHATSGLCVRFDKYRVINATNQQVEYFKYANNSAS